MKATKPLIAILAILCLALGVGLFVAAHKYKDQQKKSEETRVNLSNSWVASETELAKTKKDNTTLSETVTNLSKEVASKSSELETLSTKLAKAESDAQSAAQAAKAELEKRDAKIAELETQRDDLTKRMTELNTSITGLEKQIDDTERKLRASEGDRAFLIKELKRLQAEKAELERQFNNLALLREQVRKLRDEMSIARRLEWIRRGLYGTTSVKGAEKLQKGFTAPAAQSNFNLNVELRQDGSVKVEGTNANMAKPATNAPAAK